MTTTPTTSAPNQRVRQARTAAVASRHGQPWTGLEDGELAACVSDDDLEAFARRWGRRFLSVEQRRRRPRTETTRTGTGWVR